MDHWNVFAAGALSHLIFIRGEWHLAAPAIALALACIWLVLAGWLHLVHGLPPAHAGCKSLGHVCSLHAGLLTSIATYRVFFHRLRRFPGPALAAVSKLWHVWKVSGSKNHLFMEELRKRYGPFVRTGPNEITVFHSGILDLIDGPRSRCERPDWYDLLYPRSSTIFTRNRVQHTDRRRMWLRALSAKALASYEPRIWKHVQELDDQISKRQARPMVLNDIMFAFAFDSMGDFAFSEDFGLVRGSASLPVRAALKNIRNALAMLGPLSPAIWIPRLAFAFIPGVWRCRDWFSMLSFCDKCIKERMGKEVPDRDVSSWFIDDIHQNGLDRARQLVLSGDTATLVVAGTDTINPSLLMMLYFLARFPHHQQVILHELKSIDRFNAKDLESLPHLNGCINETMRLFPAAITFLSRLTPLEGLVVDDTWIPGGTKIVAPRYSIGRLETAYARPDKFIPERWYSKPEMIRDKRAFAPFGLGHTGCVGKPLALVTVRFVMSTLVSNYSMSFANDADIPKVESDLLDQLTAQPGKLELIFSKRGDE